MQMASEVRCSRRWKLPVPWTRDGWPYLLRQASGADLRRQLQPCRDELVSELRDFGFEFNLRLSQDFRGAGLGGMPCASIADLPVGFSGAQTLRDPIRKFLLPGSEHRLFRLVGCGFTPTSFPALPCFGVTLGTLIALDDMEPERCA